MTLDWTIGFLTLFIGSIFFVDGFRRLRRQNEWKRRWKDEE